MKTLISYQESIDRLCRELDVQRLFAFGSVLTDRFAESSDIDLIVEIGDKDPLSYSDKYFVLKFSLEEMLGRPIDLLEDRARLNPLLRKEIDRTKVLLYEA